MCVMCADGEATGMDGTQAQVAAGRSHFCTMLTRLAAVCELHCLLAVWAGRHRNSSAESTCLHWYFRRDPVDSKEPLEQSRTVGAVQTFVHLIRELKKILQLVSP